MRALQASQGEIIVQREAKQADGCECTLTKNLGVYILVPGGPGRKTRLTQERSTRGVNSQGQQFRVDDSWEKPIQSMLPTMPWTGRTIFLVDKIHTDRWGNDQRRQIIEAANLKDSQSETGFGLLEEEAHSTKSRWTKLSY